MIEITPEYLASQGLNETFLERFYRRIKITESCWLWTGSCFKTGYGEISKGGRKGGMYYAHRLSWIIHFGPIPNRLCVLHDCPGGDRRDCVNPAHLWIGTRDDNAQDMFRKGRFRIGYRCKGEKHYHHKLTARQVIAIRKMHASGQYDAIELGRIFNVTPQAIRLVVMRINWKHI